MITLTLIHRGSGLPLVEHSIVLVFTDTVFGWLGPFRTDSNGTVQAAVRSGPARVYVNGDLVGHRRLSGSMTASLGEDGSAVWFKKNVEKETTEEPTNIDAEQLPEMTSENKGVETDGRLRA